MNTTPQPASAWELNVSIVTIVALSVRFCPLIVRCAHPPKEGPQNPADAHWL